MTRSKFLSMFMLTIMLVMTMAMSFPTVAYATPSPAPNANNPNEVNVQIDPNGGLIVDIGGFNAQGGSANAWNTFIGKYKAFITGIAGIGAVTMVVLFIIQFLKLGASAGNPQARSQALVGVLWTGIAAAGLGAVAIIVGFFYNAVR